jgi:predicted nucleotidyltransferase
VTDVDVHLQQAVVRLVRALDAMQRRYCLIGALVPRFLMRVPPPERTRDVDVVVDAESMADVERLVRDLRARGYADVAPPMRFRDEAGVLVDVIPYGGALAPAGRLSLPGDIELGVQGFAHLIPHAVHIELIPGLQVAVASLPLYAMLKLAAYADRRKLKDLNGFLHCARYYEDVEVSERRYGLEHAGELTPLEFGGAFLLGLDGRPYRDPRLRERLTQLLERLIDPDAPDLDEVGREAGRLPTDDRWREACHQLIHWYRLGAQV